MTGNEIIPRPVRPVVQEEPAYRFRTQIPDAHRISLDTRIAWLWNQRFGTVQTVWQHSKDVLDHTAATLLLQAVFAKDLEAISQVFQRIEGGPQFDSEVEKDRGDHTIRL